MINGAIKSVIESHLNNYLDGIGKATVKSFSRKDRRASLAIELEGEETPIEIDLSYTVGDDGKISFSVVDTNKPWAIKAFEKYGEHFSFKLPRFARNLV